jgi:hypothetical protein
MKTLGKWLYLIGLLVAALVGMFSFSNTLVSLLLVLMGILAAIFYLDSKDLVNAGIRYLVLVAVQGVLTGIPAIGPFITGIFAGVVAFLGPVLLTLLVVHFVRKYFMPE